MKLNTIYFQTYFCLWLENMTLVALVAIEQGSPFAHGCYLRGEYYRIAYFFIYFFYLILICLRPKQTCIGLQSQSVFFLQSI